MKKHAKRRNSLKTFLRDESGAILILTTVYLPVIVGFFTMAVDMSYVYRTRNTLQMTADSAALAGVSTWINDPAFNKALACPAAMTYATTNMPIATYGNVLKQSTADCSDVLVGFWNGSAFTSDASSACGLTCNAVKVTTRMSVTNGNPLTLAFASMIGIPTFNVTATAVATYGDDPAATPWNISIVQDVSSSFAQEIGSAKAADQSLETCVLQNSSANSKIGVSVFGETAVNYQAPLTVSTNNSALTTAISNMNTSGNNPMPRSGGTDIAAGINTGISQICPGSTCSPPPTTFKPALVIVTDGLPNMCNGQSCSTSTAKTAAETAANAAKADGMDIYVLYFCNDGNGCGSAANQTPEYLASQWLSNNIATQPQPGDTKKYFFNSATPGSDFSKFMVQGICIPQHKIRLVL